jgi:hypothetical protein
LRTLLSEQFRRLRRNAAVRRVHAANTIRSWGAVPPARKENRMNDRTKALLDKLESLKDELAGYFEEAGLGKDELLRVHGALDAAHAAVASHGPVEGHDLNVDLAEKPEDHPALQGQGEKPPINLDDNVNQASTEGDVQHVVSGAEVPAEAEQPAPETHQADGPAA